MGNIDFGILFILGLGATGGILGASLFQRFRIPQVVGYIAIGILIGQSGLGIVTHHDILALRSFNLFALGLIGFLVGGEIHFETLRRYRKQFSALLLGEGLGAFFLVALPTALVVWLYTHNLSTAGAAGIVFGAIASATDPASTLDVLWEYRARGLLTTTLVAIVALDDALAMTLYGLGTSTAELLVGGKAAVGLAVLMVGVELIGAVILGVLLGLALNFVFRWMRQREKTLAISLGVILLAIGTAAALKMDIILATMALGVTLRNLAPRRSKEIFSLARNFSNPIYVIFFVLVGARLSIAQMPPWLWGLIVLYVIGRSLGKVAGAYLGARWADADRVIQRNCGLGLFAQGGVAVGLSIMASHHLGDIPVTPQMSLGDMIVFVVTATTLIVQLLGPSLVKVAIKAAGEIDRNVTEEDVLALWTVKDAMEKEPVFIRENDPLNKVVEIFSANDAASYPVVDRDEKISGILTLERLKDVLADQETWDWLVAGDIMIPAAETVQASTPLKDAFELMEQLRFEQIPVTRSGRDDRAAGVLDLRRVKRLLNEEVLRRQQENVRN